MKYLFRIATQLSLAAGFMYCGSNSTSPGADSPDLATKLTLDTNSALLSPISISMPSGATLAVDSGTIVLLFDSTDGFKPVSAGSTVLIALDDGEAGSMVEITGISMAARFRISATVNGNVAELQFLSQAESNTLSMPVSGAHWSATLSDTAIHAGSRINLYRIGGNGSYTLIGSQYVGIPTRVLAKAADGGTQQTTMGPDGTGSYQAGVDNGGSASSSTTMPSSGVYWNTYSSIPDTSITIGGATFGGPLTAHFLEIGELSTAELVAGFRFEGGVTCATWTDSRDGAQYWAELTQSAEGKTTSIKISATVANVFYLSMNLVNASTRTPVLSLTGLQPDGNGVHAPDGSVIADPYQDASLKFGGFKELKFATKDETKGVQIKDKVKGAGYEVSHLRYANKVYQFDVNLTLDGRKKIEEDILQKEGWFPRPPDATWRNRGFYDFNDSLFINISSHGSGDKVNAMVQAVTGTFTNAAGDPDTVTKMKVIWTYLGSVNSAMATLGNGGTSFSVNCSLYTGDNTFIFQPYVIDKYGEETYQTHQIIKAKETRTPLFVLNYKEQRNAVLTIHSVTTTRAHEPDTSLSIHDKTITINLIMTPLQVALKSIQTNENSAIACASSQSCSILSGVSDSTGAVTVSESYQTHTKNCDHELPLINVGSGSGTMTLNNYGVGRVYVSLLPPGTGTRHYALVVDARTTMAMKATPNDASTGRYYSCADSAWHNTTSDIWPSILLTKDDTPPVLQFGNTASIEDYVAAPDGGASWSFTGTEYGSDSISVTQYDATLSVSAP